jgi:hypothetical protein
MQRGITLFNELSYSDILPNKASLGRDKDLINKRNELLLDRLYFYKKVFYWDYAKMLGELSKEFFLSEKTIPKIIEKPESQLYLRTLKLQQPSKKILEEKWPHLKWAA